MGGWVRDGEIQNGGTQALPVDMLSDGVRSDVFAGKEADVVRVWTFPPEEVENPVAARPLPGPQRSPCRVQQ